MEFYSFFCGPRVFVWNFTGLFFRALFNWFFLSGLYVIMWPHIFALHEIYFVYNIVYLCVSLDFRISFFFIKSPLLDIS